VELLLKMLQWRIAEKGRMNTNEQEIAAVSDSAAKKNELQEMLPIVRFIVHHPLELFALAITLIGIAGFAAGSSFYDGWNKAAGISGNLFPVGSYETILAGMTLSKPWIYSGLTFAFLIIYIQLIELSSEWSHARWGRENFWRRHRRNKIAMAARCERMMAGIQVRGMGAANKAWSKLEHRNRWGKRKEPLSYKDKQRLRVPLRFAVLVVALSLMFTGWLFYLGLKAFIVDKAFAQGAEKYVGLYLAVTGKIPPQFEHKFDRTRMQELACLGEETRWSYRSVDLLGDGKYQAYIIQSTDKLFLLLDKDGSTLHSFGDAAFSLRESSVRPASKLSENCKKAVAKK
jgi:hypothetical protein